MINSSSSHCFVSLAFVQRLKLHKTWIAPLALKLFNGSSRGEISLQISISVTFPTGEVISLDFLVTPIDLTCSAVLGYNFLTCYNPLIDWVKGSVTFPSAGVVGLVNKSTGVQLPKFVIDFNTLKPTSETPDPAAGHPTIAIVNATEFAWVAQLTGSDTFILNVLPKGKSALRSVSADLVDLTSVLEVYHDFADVFSKAWADMLAPHHPYNLHIQLEEGKASPPGPIYSLSQPELRALREFLDEHLTIGFI